MRSTVGVITSYYVRLITTVRRIFIIFFFAIDCTSYYVQSIASLNPGNR